MIPFFLISQSINDTSHYDLNATTQLADAIIQQFEFLPMIMIIMVIIIMIGMAISVVMRFTIGSSDFESEESEEEVKVIRIKPHKQTYEEYVDERIRIEKKIHDRSL